jgi:hypothetical protein
LVQSIRIASFERSPFGENERWPTAAAVTPRLAGPAPFQVTPPMAAATRIAFGALAGDTETRLPVRTAAQPRNRGRIADHSEIGPTTWYQVEPSALRGPATIATRLFAERLPSREAEVSVAARTASPSTRTVPKPPTAIAAGVAATCEATFQALQLPRASRARTRKA